MRKRIICLLVAVLFIFSSLSARIGYIMLSARYIVEAGYNSYSINIDNLDYQLYYRNGEKLTNNIESYVAIIKPSEKCIGELYKYFSLNEINNITEELSKGYPIKYELNDKFDSKYIKVFKTYKSSYTCNQLLNKTSSGLFNYLEMPQNNRKISFSVDAKGRLLSGDNGSIYVPENDNNSLTLTIDNKLQETAYNACKNMKSGCCIIMNVESGQILACVNKPNETYINKCFTNYSVGSVFKLIISACALENNINPIYNCTGSIKVGDTEFSCQNNNHHGYQMLIGALANSCNCYFVNLALKLGSDKILETAKAFGFDSQINLYDNWSIKSSYLPASELLQSKGQLALIGFGQGEFLSTPLQICSSLCTIGNLGNRTTPSIILAKNNQEAVISEKTAKSLIKDMRYVVENGTGKNADDKKHLSAGKTATAQTGSYVAGNEILNTWFAGIYPYDNPKYAIVVMTENGISGSVDCCPIFRTIVENIE